MIRLTFCFALALTLPMLEPAFAETLSIDDILESETSQEYVNALNPTDRAAVVRGLADALKERRDNTDIAKLLCAIAPWTTGNPQNGVSDDQLQTYMWDEMALQEVNSDAFRWLDCAAANRIGFYRASALSPLYDLRQSYCASLPISPDMKGHLRQVESGIRAFDARLEAGLTQAIEAAGTSPRHSFFPMQNKLRLAVVRSALAVEIARRDNDWAAAQVEFAALAAELRETASKSDYASTRNGWTFPNDLAFFAAVYAWVAGADDTLAMDPLLNWPPLLDDANILTAVPLPLREQIKRENSSYVDMIFVERLFPGASEGTQECGGWRRRSYNVHELSAAVDSCAKKLGRPDGIDALSRLDSCILEYDASDWRVEFRRVRQQEVALAELQIPINVKEIMKDSAVMALPEAEQASLAAALSGYRKEGESRGWVVFATDRVITTAQRTLLEQVFDRVRLTGVRRGDRPLIARPKMY